MKIALKKHFCSIFICFIALFLFPLNTFAYSIPSNWFLPYSRIEIRTDYQSNVTPDLDEFLNLNLDSPLRMGNPRYSSTSGQTWVLMLPQYDLTKDTVFIFNCRSYSPCTIDKFTFYPTTVSLGFTDHYGSLTWFTPDDIHIFHRDIYSSDLFLGYTVVFTLPSGFDNYFSRISFSGSGNWPEMAVSLYSYYPDSADDSNVSDLTAILRVLEEIDTSIDSGNSSTGIIIDDFDNTQDNFNQVLADYRATESVFFNQFQEYNGQLSATFNGWSWGGLVNCADWVGSTLTSYYNNMGDFRQYIIYPLMLGIALFFLGRGSSIIGHLYRKPTETFTHIERSSETWKSGGTTHSVTNVLTRRSGGKLRK